MVNIAPIRFYSNALKAVLEKLTSY